MLQLTEIKKSELEEIPFSPARVKWFNPNKGFGFAKAFGCPDDIFIHVDVLRQAGLNMLDAGEGIGLRYFRADKGAIAFEISL